MAMINDFRFILKKITLCKFLLNTKILWIEYQVAHTTHNSILKYTANWNGNCACQRYIDNIKEHFEKPNTFFSSLIWKLKLIVVKHATLLVCFETSQR